MKKAILIFILFFIFLGFTASVEAKLLPRFKTSIAKKLSGASNTVGIRPKLRSDRKALQVYFSNLGKASSVTYTLIYQTNGKDEGVSGSLDTSAGNSATREILFGTCSSGICRNHGSISKMKLEVITELKTGKKFLRRFGIKV